MGSAGSIRTTNTMSSLSRNEYVTALYQLHGDLNKLSCTLFDKYIVILGVDIGRGMPPSYYISTMKWMNIVYIKVVNEMNDALVKYQTTNWQMLETTTDRLTEHYWAKYIKGCLKQCEEIEKLNAQQQDINDRLKDYLTQSRDYRKSRPDDKNELARLTKIQKKINADAVSLRGDVRYFCECFKVEPLNQCQINTSGK